MRIIIPLLYEIPPLLPGMVINLIAGLGELLPRKEYESAVIIGRGLKGIGGWKQGVVENV